MWRREFRPDTWGRLRTRCARATSFATNLSELRISLVNECVLLFFRATTFINIYVCSLLPVQARTTTFNQTDPANVLFAPDVVTFAQSIGAYPKNAPAADFNFREAYDPITFSGAVSITAAALSSQV